MPKKLTTEQFIARANTIHGHKYDYSQVNYENNSSPVKIICIVHGEFTQMPYAHIGKNKQGCPKCANNVVLGNYEFIARATEVHGVFYDYSKVQYVNQSKKVIIVCPYHGAFEQSPYSHLNGRGCFKCYGSEKITNSIFVERAVKIHGERYDYSDVNCNGIENKVIIKCKIHGYFEQSLHSHLNGNGCPSCAKHYYGRITNGERLIIDFLENNKIKYIHQYHFNDCRYKNRILIFDFYLPNNNSIIEFNGCQHYEPVSVFGGYEQFIKQQEKDKIKRNYCTTKGIKLLEVPYWKINDIDPILRNELYVLSS